MYLSTMDAAHDARAEICRLKVGDSHADLKRRLSGSRRKVKPYKGTGVARSKSQARANQPATPDVATMPLGDEAEDSVEERPKNNFMRWKEKMRLQM